ncbi:bifunctional ATP-dependent DNA helicase/DNA polymerase III subunit epsilon [Raoultella terrigena]|uniref:Bifunctional ATP-dependent DNA helicase/DNA polymerase III subunit epsilon n=1 Tax=Raoultella terrigena TaxID=577 RepID=A0A4U9CVC9_RAOTE|nr:bifunctional ATP-dependent DNA helicase/DNA polymerase III subunit epsilon [Raoultella terrigena]
MEDCRLRGGDPFDEVQLPDAVITLKQGVGRLIRDIGRPRRAGHLPITVW